MLKVLKAGFYTTVQDSGRFYFRNKGIPVSGVMDEMTVFKVNSLLENEVSAAVLEILGSRSFYKPITKVNRLRDNDVVPFIYNKLFQPKISEIKVDSFLDINKLEVSKGPEFYLLTDRHLEEIFSKSFTVAHENNRMAYQIKENISSHEVSMLTSATLPGTVQLTPGGKLIVLMKDGQTTGGYPRVLQLTDKAICILAQKRGGDKVNFKLV